MNFIATLKIKSTTADRRGKVEDRWKDEDTQQHTEKGEELRTQEEWQGRQV